MRLHHVQVAMPPGQEEAARRFYGEALGMVEVAKPEVLAERGGCWFRAERDGVVTAEIHVSGEEPFTPARKAHPALLVDDVAGLEALADRVGGGGFEVDWSNRHTLEGFERFHCRDAFGNRVEVLAANG